MITAILISSQLQLVLSYSKTQFEYGEKIVALGSGNILQTSYALPRSQIVDVTFQKEFLYPPQVFLSLVELDWPSSLPQGISLKADFIHTTGFKIIGSAVSSQPVSSLYAYWVAIYDPRIQIIEYESYDVRELKTAQGARTVQFQFEHNLKDASNGIIALIGVQHISFNVMAKVQIVQITQNTVIFEAIESSSSKIGYLKVNVLLGTDQSLWSSLPKDQYYYGQPFSSRDPGAYSVYQQFPYPQGLKTGQNFPIASTRGYNVEGSRNVRMHMASATITTVVNFQIFTWWDTLIYEFYSQVAIYQDEPDFKILDPNCAELFSECNFNGDSKIICDKIPDLQGNGWSNPIKSITIPLQRTLYLFNQKYYVGEKHVFIENQSCIDFSTDILSAQFTPLFSFIKILFFTVPANNCLTVKFYSQCNYQGSMYQVSKGQPLKIEIKIPFEIKSIAICPNAIVKLRGPKYFGGTPKEFSSSQTCLDGYQFPKYVQQN